MLTDNILDLIGRTPLIRLQGEAIFAKAEFLNPGGSIKDRVALAMIEGAERDRLYEKFKSAGPHFATYEQNTSRIIPVVRLTPV